MQTRLLPTPARAGRSEGITFATDFSGMDMVVDASVLADIPARQLSACDIWSEARAFAGSNHKPERTYGSV